MDIEKQQQFVDLCKDMTPLDITVVFMKLLEGEQIDFVRLAEVYIEYLERIKKKNQGSIVTLGLMLATYCITDTSAHGKTARRHLRDSGAYGHNDGSTFGKQLDEEFGNEKSENDYLKEKINI